MPPISKLKPFKRFGPGFYIREQMETRSWTQEDMADILGVSIKHINSILQDTQALTYDVAKQLSEVFDTSAKYWMNLDANYRLWKDQSISEKQLSADIKSIIFEKMPIRDMVKKGWIEI